MQEATGAKKGYTSKKDIFEFTGYPYIGNANPQMIACRFG
jgi:hypothetical protein